jgi:putative heme transporter
MTTTTTTATSMGPLPERSDDPDLHGGRDPWRELIRLVVLVLVAIVTAQTIGRLSDVVGLVLLAVVLALMTEPVRRRLSRYLPSGLATAITALVTFGAVLVVGFVLMRGLAAEADRLSDALAGWIDGLRAGSLPARVADALQASDGVAEVFGQVPSVVVTGEDDTIGVGRRVIDLLLVVIIAAFVQASAASMFDRAVGLWPRSARGGVRAFVLDVVGRGGGYVRRVVILGLVTWLPATAIAAVADLPGAVVLGAWMAVWVAVPWVGTWVGGAPLVAVGLATGPWTGVGVMLAIAGLGLVAGLARRRWVEARTVVVGAAPTVIAFAAGTAIGGVRGLLVCFGVVAIAVAWATSPSLPVRPSHVPLDPEHDAVPAANGVAEGRVAPRGMHAVVVPSPSGITLVPGWRGALTMLGAVALGALAWMLLRAAADVAVWLVVAVLGALALHRPVSWVERFTGAQRPVAITVVTHVIIGVVVATAALAVAGGAATTDELGEGLPTAVEDLTALPVVGPWLEAQDAPLWVSEQVENLPQRLREARDTSEWLPTVGARLLDAFWVIVLVMALLVDGPRLVPLLEQRIPAHRRRQASRLLVVSHRAVGGYLAGAALVATLNGVVVFAIALAIGVVLAPVLALWAFAWNFVPQIGGFMGGFPLVVLALAEGPVRAVVAGVLFVGYQFVENHLIQPAVISEAIDVPAWVALLGALAGGAAFGVVGAVALTPLVGVVRVVVREMRRPDFPGSTVPTLSPRARAAPT